MAQDAAANGAAGHAHALSQDKAATRGNGTTEVGATKANADEAEPPEQTEEKPLQIGDRCEVLWRDKTQQLQAIIIERRPVNYTRKRKKKGKTNDPDLETLKIDEIQYYVHYEGQDRRLDEWILIDKFILGTLKRVKDESDEKADDSRKLRRRSGVSSHSGSGHAGSGGGHAGSFSMSGGNWHGGSGDPSLAALEREHEETTKVKNIEKIVMGEYEVECWYFSPYPEEYAQAERLYICEFCLTYMRKPSTYRDHKANCACRHPPGKEIYRETGLSVFEIDGKEHRAYCQNLCLLAKLFLDHKTLYYDVDPFYFYIICQVDDSGAHIVGYFSKEKVSQEDYNLACILTFPQYQKHGYGKFIISFSYELTKLEAKTGSPEKPLSDLGKISYRSYWKYILFNIFSKHDPTKNISVEDISVQTGIKREDIISTLQSLDMIKCWKGQHVIYVKQGQINEYMSQVRHPRLCKPDCLEWKPPKSNN